MPSTNNIDIYQGEDRVLTFTMSPVESVSGWTTRLTVDKIPPTTGNLVEKDGAVVGDGTAGQFTFSFTSAETAAYTAADHKYDVWRTDSGSARILATGRFRILAPPRQTT